LNLPDAAHAVVETSSESSYDEAMQNVAIHKARELSPETRMVVENELGRPLRRTRK
jgi:hypothetical protein